jgi:ABC-type polysaccharide/polyol phosphate transport system ATPase subunit
VTSAANRAGPPAIELTDVTLGYRLSRSRSGSLKEFMIHLVKRQVSFEQFLALRGVTFQVRPGEVVAIIGANGAGKSTTMKVMARVLPPTGGRVVVRGRVAPMIELGAGFNMDMTGYENVVLYGALLGREAAAMRAAAGRIADWAGLAHAMDQPVRSYSSGMLARLAFSIAVDVEPDVLLVDEVLSVGDEAFQRKSADRMTELIRSGTAVVLVTHNLDQVLEKADRVLWLEDGRVRCTGLPSEVVPEYRQKSLSQS